MTTRSAAISVARCHHGVGRTYIHRVVGHRDGDGSGAVGSVGLETWWVAAQARSGGVFAAARTDH